MDKIKMIFISLYFDGYIIISIYLGLLMGQRVAKADIKSPHFYFK